MSAMYIPLGKLITSLEKYEQTIKEIDKGELSYSFGMPCTISYCPDAKKYLIMDGNHRAIEKAMQGQKKVYCELNKFVPKYYPTGNYITLTKKPITL